MDTPPKRGPGRPRTDPTGLQQPCQVRLTPTEREYLTTRYGSINGGLRQILAEKMAGETAEIAAKRKKSR